MRTLEQIQENPQITHFDRHASMSKETHQEIMDLITELMLSDCKCARIILNWLYGAFDGYDYSEVVIFSKELAELSMHDAELAVKVAEIYSTIENYPRV